MNFKNKYLLTTLRVLFGLFMIFSGVSGLLAGKDAQGVPEPIADASQALWNSGLFQMIKVTEIAAGLMLALNLLPALAAILIAPIAVGIAVFNGVLAPSLLPMVVIVWLFEAYFGYAYWPKYKALFTKT